MRLAIDLQAAQICGDGPAIGQNALELALAMARSPRGNEVVVLLNGTLRDGLHGLHQRLRGVLSARSIVLWHEPSREGGLNTAAAHHAATAWIRASAIASEAPDALHLGSMAVGTTRWPEELPAPPTFANLDHGLGRPRLDSGPVDSFALLREVQPLRHYRGFIAFSEFDANAAIERLGIAPAQVDSVGRGVGLQLMPASSDRCAALRSRLGLPESFILAVAEAASDAVLATLLHAYATLPPQLRRGHKLVLLAGGAARSLHRQAVLPMEEVQVLGALSQEELRILYTACNLLLLHGDDARSDITALEAFACGAPVIMASGSGSAPIALLPDRSEAARISAIMARALMEPAFRTSLLKECSEKAANSTWANAAQRAWEAFERRAATRPCRPFGPKTPSPKTPSPRTRRRLAHFGPLPPAPSGVADAANSVLPALRQHYDITLFADAPKEVDAALREAFPVLETAAFPAMAESFDRILYQVGNSPFHRQAVALLPLHPGVVLLHDVLLGNLMAGIAGAEFSAMLFEAEGWPSIAFLAEHGYNSTVWAHALLRSLLSEAVGAIVHSGFALKILREASDIPARKAPLPVLYGHLAGKTPIPARAAARLALGIPEGELVVVSFGSITRMKCPELVVAGFLEAFAGQADVRLVLAGEQLDNAAPLPAAMRDARARVTVTGRLTPDDWRNWLAAADIAVQLRQASRGESSGAVMDVMAAGLPTIVNAHGAMAELPDDAVLLLPESATSRVLAGALRALAADPLERTRLGAAARAHIEAAHGPAMVAAHYVDAIEAAYATPSRRTASERLIRGIAALPIAAEIVAPAIAATLPAHGSRRLLVDVSIVARQDTGTGIQRVTREIARRLLSTPQPGWRIEALRGDMRGLMLSREWAAHLLRLDCPAPDELAEAGPGDRILLLDFPGMIDERNMEALRQAQTRGAELIFVLYDLLPVLHPEWFPRSVAGTMAAYQRHLLSFVDAVLCISHAVAKELVTALNIGEVTRRRTLDIGWFHLGSDFRADIAGVVPAGACGVALDAMARMPSLLMVGTIEPRKGHAQALEAFEALWRDGQEIALVIAGNKGWMTEKLCKKITTHPEFGHRLYWLRQPSDGDLANLYNATTGLLAASLAEGFGLPLVEASRAGKPILARDIPIFREVTGGHALWFSGDEAAVLAAAVREFLTMKADGNLPDPKCMHVLSWDESADALRLPVLGEDWPMRWAPQEMVADGY